MMLVMDGAHDLGGRLGFGSVPIEVDEPVFHEPWEGRVWALQTVIRRHTTIDRFRATIERMPDAQYLASSYYERWLWALEFLAAEQGILDRAERPARVELPSPSTPTWSGRFEPGGPARVRDVVSKGHSRVPRYLRGHVGRVERVAFAWPNPVVSASTGVYGAPELVYTLVFSAADLFGPGADHTVSADLSETDLEVAWPT
jgi:hypothetical protein